MNVKRRILNTPPEGDKIGGELVAERTGAAFVSKVEMIDELKTNTLSSSSQHLHPKQNQAFLQVPAKATSTINGVNPATV